MMRAVMAGPGLKVNARHSSRRRRTRQWDCRAASRGVRRFFRGGERRARFPDEASEEKNNLTGMIRKLDAGISMNIKARDGIASVAESIDADNRRYAWLKSLADTVNGTVPGCDKIMLETYVQTVYFDRIINCANSRFMIMSDGRYELRRCRTAQNRRTQSGLELEVIDHYNGST